MENYHFIGIGGVGMSALARILLDKKAPVSGSDIALSTTIVELKERGAHVSIGHSSEIIPKNATIVYSSDIKKDNPEFQHGEKSGLKMLHRSELLRDLSSCYKTLAIAGTHGKTTTTSLLAFTLIEAGIDPAFAVGGMIPGLSNGKSGKGDYFVLEADESDGTFINYAPFGAIVTNIEPEHMVHYKTVEKLHQAFKEFVCKVGSSEHFFYCGDDPGLAALGLTKGISYGFGSECSLRIDRFRASGWSILYDLHFDGKIYRDIEVSLPGRHNALNSSACFGLCLKLGIPETAIRAAFKKFVGVKRRLEKKGEFRNVLLLDDYAHHPTEIRATLSALREAVQERRIIALFQPHRYSRVSDHLEEFASSFDFADQVFITEIYGAREEPIPGITSDTLLAKIREKSTVPIEFISRGALCEKLRDYVRPHDVVVTLGAGCITHLHGELIKEFEKEPPKKYILGLIYGGKSCEHEISLRSAKFVASSLDSELYDVRYFGITKAGKWISGERALQLLGSSVSLEGDVEGQSILHLGKEIEECDLFFPVLHGPFGEDGTIQGFFEMLGKAYAGPDFRSAAITMDKVLTKKLLLAEGVPTPPYITFSYWEWRKNNEEVLKKIEGRHFSYPVYVKPTRVGSSIGVTPVKEKESLKRAIEYAFRFDSSVIVEEGMVRCREIEFPVLGNDRERISVALPGEKCAEGEFVDYEKKYSSKPVRTETSPQFPPGILEKGQKTAIKAYEGCGLTGMARVDSLLDDQGTFWFFEINSIPGLTNLSLFPKMWAKEGMEGKALMDRLIVLGLHRHFEQNRFLK